MDARRSGVQSHLNGVGRLSIGVNMIGLLILAGGALSPVATAILHIASSIAVVGNSSRPIRYRVHHQ